MSFIIYIDESGDEGFSEKSSRWFGMSCVVVKKESDLSLVVHRNTIINKISRNKKNPLRSIHFSDLKHEQRKFICNYIVDNKLPVRAINVVINKDNIPEQTRANYRKDKNIFYWYTARLLLERISWLIKDYKSENSGFPKIIFSNRRQSKVKDFICYLYHLKTKNHSKIDWDIFKIDENHIKSIPHNKMAGLQFADCFATAFRKYVFETNSLGGVETSYAKILKPFVYNKNGNYKSYGYKILGETSKCQKDTKILLIDYKIEEEASP